MTPVVDGGVPADAGDAGVPCTVGGSGRHGRVHADDRLRGLSRTASRRLISALGRPTSSAAPGRTSMRGSTRGPTRRCTRTPGRAPAQARVGATPMEASPSVRRLMAVRGPEPEGRVTAAWTGTHPVKSRASPRTADALRRVVATGASLTSRSSCSRCPASQTAPPHDADRHRVGGLDRRALQYAARPWIPQSTLRSLPQRPPSRSSRTSPSRPGKKARRSRSPSPGDGGAGSERDSAFRDRPRGRRGDGSARA